MRAICTDDEGRAEPIWAVTVAEYNTWLTQQPDVIRNWLSAGDFTFGAGKMALLPGTEGALAGVLLCLDDNDLPWQFSDLPRTLPKGRYFLATELSDARATSSVVGWSLGAYRFDRYIATGDEPAELQPPANADMAYSAAVVRAVVLGRDLINTPAADMGPAQLAEIACAMAERHQAQCMIIVGDELLLENYPAVHAVGRASINRPRLIDLTWGDPDAPKVTLVGKGVCFDSGGLDLKSAAGMAKMKKDMGGAATMMALAGMIMELALPVRLRLLVAAVENAVSGSAMRPGDVLQTRKGLTVEIGNTDAEGRLVLCDALAEADLEQPDLLIDCATLTGAARVALGPELPALFSNDDTLAEEILAQGIAHGDPFWRLPLYDPYDKMLDSKIADLNNVSDGSFAGAITAGLYLRRFVSESKSWAHIDSFGWNDKARPGRPVGGEALGLRALYGVIAARYGS